jgi:xanthosine utilization system XapX-like protein
MTDLKLLQLLYQVIIQLVRSLDTIKVPAARAMIVWLLGEYCSLGEIIPRMLSTVLKYLAWCFTSEELETKLQILNTITKVYIIMLLLHFCSKKPALIYIVAYGLINIITGQNVFYWVFSLFLQWNFFETWCKNLHVPSLVCLKIKCNKI